jgi:arylformamidase
MMQSNGYSPDELEQQYNLRIARPDYESKVVPAWIERSAAYRASSRCTLNLAYGSLPRERLDFFPSGIWNSPVLIYFHGGYWQRGDKSMYSFLAEPFVKNGVSVALVNYDLCPSVRLSQIGPQARQAVAWVWQNAREFGFSQEKVYVMGHSAGGHITGMIMATHWPAIGADLPRDLVKAGIPISALFELEPLRHTSINTGIRMDEAEAAAGSLKNHPPATDAPQLVVCGGAETPEFQRQSDMYAATFATARRHMDRYIVPGCDHFDEINELANEDSVLFQKSLHLITG